MNSAQKNTLLQFFKAVGQPERLRLLGILANERHSIADLVTNLGLKETAVLHNVRILKKAGLVQEQVENDTAVFQLNSDGLLHMQQIIAGEYIPDTFEEEVMKKYVQNETLTAIPQDAREREIILDWLAQKFDLQHRYTEEEVTAIVANHYPYPLILRRILADNHFLMKTGRQYWRPLPKVK